MKKNTTEFRMPSLGEADAEYGAMEARLAELRDERSKTVTAISDLERDMAVRPTPSLKPEVAALLGQTVDSELAGRSTRLRELREQNAHFNEAISIIQQKIADRKGAASIAACAMVRDEYARRISALVKALEVVKAARLHADALLDDLEAEGVEYARLPSMRALFLGHPEDGAAARFVAEARENGYVN